MKNRSYAFTLIELLVVIAIVAILAAILFPVFAQAKEAAKKTQSLSNTKQTATAMTIYSGDADDSYPIASGVNNNGTLDVGRYNGFPAGWDSATYEFGDSVVWANSVQPYMKNMDLLEAPGIQRVQMTSVFGAAAYANPRKKPGASALVFNGDLSTFSATGIAQPSQLVVLWYGFGKENLVGGANMQPALNCAISKVDCRFNPGSLPSADGPYPGVSAATGDIFWSAFTDANDSVWMYGQGQNMARADTSAKFYKIGGNPGTTLASTQDPYRSYGRKGEYWQASNRCVAVAGSTARYSSFFRPDAEFRHQIGNSATTLCFP